MRDLLSTTNAMFSSLPLSALHFRDVLKSLIYDKSLRTLGALRESPDYREKLSSLDAFSVDCWIILMSLFQKFQFLLERVPILRVEHFKIEPL